MKRRPLAKQKMARPSKKNKAAEEGFSFSQPRPKKQAQGPTAHCPACDALVSFAKRPKPDMKVRCPDCRTDLEVTSLAPLMLDFPSEESDEWDWK